MNPKLKKALKRVRAVAFKTVNFSKEPFNCPICLYNGPFIDANDPTGLRINAMCPNCSCLERHRLQWLVMSDLSQQHNFSKMSLLHFAPEPAMKERFEKLFGIYKTADLNPAGVDYAVDLRKLPFPDHSFDVIFASHVLEHIKEDTVALANIKRVLKPGGMAILPVPLVGLETVEYPEPNPKEWDHVRAPGYDYYDRFKGFFSRVEKKASSDFPNQFQPFIYEDRSRWPTETFPLRRASEGTRHEDVVPVCYV